MARLLEAGECGETPRPPTPRTRPDQTSRAAERSPPPPRPSPAPAPHLHVALTPPLTPTAPTEPAGRDMFGLTALHKFGGWDKVRPPARSDHSRISTAAPPHLHRISAASPPHLAPPGRSARATAAAPQLAGPPRPPFLRPAPAAARRMALRARAAPMHPGASPQQLGGLRRPQYLAAAGARVEDFPRAQPPGTSTRPSSTSRLAPTSCRRCTRARTWARSARRSGCSRSRESTRARSTGGGAPPSRWPRRPGMRTSPRCCRRGYSSSLLKKGAVLAGIWKCRGSSR